MKRRLLGIALLGAALWATTTEASAFGGRKKKNDCDAPCGPTMTAGYGCGYTVSYIDQKVTAYKTEWDTRDVKVWVNEWVCVKEDYKYWVCEPKTTKQTVVCKEMKWRDEPCKYWTHEWVTVKDTIKVAQCKPVTRPVECTVYDLKPTVTKHKRTVCDWVCVPVVVTCVVAPAPSGDSGRGGLFSRLCGKKKKNDCAAPCPAPCEEPCGHVVTKTVMQRQPITREVEVDVTTYERIPRKVVHQVTTHEIVCVDQVVDVRKCVPKEHDGVRKVCYWVDVPKEIDVTTWHKVEKPGTRNVWKCIPVEKPIKQHFCKHVPYETIVKVPVYTPNPCPTPCFSPCASPCGPVMSGGHGSLHGDCCK